METLFVLCMLHTVLTTDTPRNAQIINIKKMLELETWTENKLEV